MSKRDRPSISSLLRALDRDRLARGLEMRPDLLVPVPPASIGDLAGRIVRPHSVATALAGCDEWCRQVADVALLLRGPTSAAAIADLIRTNGGDVVTAAEVDRGIAPLADRLLLFVDATETIWLNPGLVEAVPRPCGLGPSAAEYLPNLSPAALRGIATAVGVSPRGSKFELAAAIAARLADRHALEDLLADAPAEAVTLLRRAVTGSVELPYPGWSATMAARGNPLAWLFTHGLLVERMHSYGYGYGRAESPREVGLALRGGVAVTTGAPVPPALTAVAVGEAAELDRRAAVRAGSTVRSVASLLGLLDAAPAAALKSGGLGPREVSRLAKGLGLATEDAFVLLEIAAEADLVAPMSYEHFAPTSEADSWLSLTLADRWVALARAWLSAPGIPSIAGRKDPSGRLVPGIVTVTGIDGHGIRRATLDALASASPGDRAVGDMTAVVRWTVPAALEGLDSVAGDFVRWTIAEAATLGLAVDGALTTVGRLLHARDPAAAADHAAALLLEAPAEVILQADLTAVVDAAAPQRVLDELRLLADAESAGSAVVLRFSAASVRRALDTGRSADEILAFLAEHATRGVPQPLEYLVTDTARRWGSVRVGAIVSYVRSDDPVLLEEVIRHRRLAKLKLRLLAPTVAASKAKPAELLTALRGAGFLPVEENADGIVLRAAPRQKRAVTTVRPAGGEAEPVDLSALAAALLAAGDAPAPPVPHHHGSRNGHRRGRRTRTGDLDINELRDLLDSFGPDFLEQVVPGPMRSLFDADFGEDFVLIDGGPAPGDGSTTGPEVFDFLDDVGVDPGDIVELCYLDPDTGRERAVTGPLVDVDVHTGRVTVERQPDGTMVTVAAVDVFDIRLLEAGGR